MLYYGNLGLYVFWSIIQNDAAADDDDEYYCCDNIGF